MAFGFDGCPGFFLKEWMPYPRRFLSTLYTVRRQVHESSPSD